jgi:hypothetical protein
MTEYRFNPCGYRTALACGPKPPGVYRIVLIGGSSAMGMRVPSQKTFAELLPTALSRKTGLKVEVYNQGMPWRPPHVIATHFDSILAAQPDMILWILAPSDVWQPLLPPTRGSGAARTTQAPAGGPNRLAARIGGHLDSGPATLFRHFYYLSPTQTVASYLRESPNEVYMRKIHGPEAVRVNPSPEWKAHLVDLDRDIANLESQARAAGVPVVATLLPERSQAAMISNGHWPGDVDPYKLDREMQAMVVGHGGVFLDIERDLSAVPNGQALFFPLEGHPNALGHAVFSQLLTRRLTQGPAPMLTSATRVAATPEPKGGRGRG